VALAGAFAAYQVQPQQPDPVASSVAAYHQHALPPGGLVADGSGTALTTKSASGKSGKSAKTGSKATAGHHQPARARTARRLARTPKAPAATPLPSASASAAPSNSSSGGSVNLKAAVRKDIAAGNYLLAIGQYLVENGYSKAAAAGVAGCVAGESGGNPESVGSGGGGLIGWTPLGSAAPNANIITGNPAQDMMTQLADLLYYNSSEIGQSLVTQLNAITDPVSAADFFSANFEKPAVLYSDVRPAVAQQVFAELGGLCAPGRGSGPPAATMPWDIPAPRMSQGIAVFPAASRFPGYQAARPHAAGARPRAVRVAATARQAHARQGTPARSSTRPGGRRA